MSDSFPVDAKRLLIVGCGYVGEQVVREARAAGQQVCALTRSESRCEELRALGVQPLVGHWLEPASLKNLPSVDMILISVPHRPQQNAAGDLSEQEINRTHAVGLNNLLQAIPNTWRKLVYLSTTGVYGQDSHDLVDEETPVHPTRSGPQMAVTAEQWLSDHVAHNRFTVLRLSGIYGPGRIPLADKLRRAEPLAVPLDGYLNLVHVNDIARMILIVADRDLQRSMYVFSDGQPVLREIFYRRVAQLYGAREPVFTRPDPHDAKLRRATDKRIHPARLVAETNFVYQFPDYDSGLRAIVQASRGEAFN